MRLRVFLTGASGFVGSAVLHRLLAAGHWVNALVHRHDVGGGDERVRSVRGDITDPAALDEAMGDCSAAIHLVGIIAEKPKRNVTFQRMHVGATRAVVEAAQRGGIRRYVHMSALGAREGAPSAYHQTKWDAEKIVRASSLDWIIFRPSLIHGPGGEFTQMQIAWAQRRKAPWLFMPYFGRGFLGAGGAGLLQPIHVGDVARAFVEALENDASVRKTYCLAGSQRLTWPEFHRVAAEALVGQKRWTLALPAWKARLLTRIVPRALLPFTREQVTMALEDNTCDTGEFVRDFKWQPAGFAQAVRTYAASAASAPPATS